MKRKILCLLLVALLTIIILSSCNNTNMPFNGDITFHNISLTVDEKFIRDSTQSTDDLWFFEKGFYREYIILSRKDAGKNIAESLSNYADYLIEQGVDAEIATFLNDDAVFSSYTQDGMYCQEVLFPHDGSFYAISLRGGTEEDFNTLITTVQIATNTDS